MANVDPTHKKRFLCSFRATTESTAKEFSASRTAYAYTHWKIWSYLCANMALNPLVLLYKDPILILAKFASE